MTPKVTPWLLVIFFAGVTIMMISMLVGSIIHALEVEADPNNYKNRCADMGGDYAVGGLASVSTCTSPELYCELHSERWICNEEVTIR